MSVSTPIDKPAILGYRMSAEWEPHEGVWFAWPHNLRSWPKQIPQVEKIYAQMLEALTPHEKVFLLVNSAQSERRVREILAAYKIYESNLKIYHIVTADSWIRDYGPNFLIREKDGRKELAFNHWEFNAWGNKYEELIQDSRVPTEIEKILKIPVYRPGLVLEGGSIDVNGCGTVLTTEQCLLSTTRNPMLDQYGVEKALRDYLGATNVIWLGEGIAGDDTDGHIDDMVRFVNPDTVVCALEDDKSEKNHLILKENFKRLKNAKIETGENLNILPLPMPGILEYRGERLPASYANFLVANNIVLVPIFEHRNDDKALSVIESAFPKRQIVGIPCQELVVGRGAIHCVSQPQPKVSES